MIDTRALIREFRPNAKNKYYEILEVYIEKILCEPDIEYVKTVEELTKVTGTTRPTFYKYFKNVEAFYQEVAEIYFGILPGFFTSISKAMGNGDMIHIIFKMKTGLIIRNLQKLSAFVPSIKDKLETYYLNAIRGTAGWYGREFDMDHETAQDKARMVINELIINGEFYYGDLGAYTALMKNQRTAAIPGLNTYVKQRVN